jgi:hypothetical protein
VFLIAYLTGRDIDDQLAELDRVARPLETFRRHSRRLAMPRLNSVTSPGWRFSIEI